MFYTFFLSNIDSIDKQFALWFWLDEYLTFLVDNGTMSFHNA